MKFLLLVLITGASFLNGFCQQSTEPRITARISYEKKRNPQVEKAIFSAFDINKTDDKTTRYYYNYVDLNGDGVTEVLVYLFGGHFCGTGGCDAALFRKVNGRYRVVSSFEPVRNPILVSSRKSHGWNDLIFFISGGGINPGYYSVTKFNGRKYFDNPTVVKDAPPLKSRVRAFAVLVGKGYGDSGLGFKF